MVGNSHSGSKTGFTADRSQVSSRPLRPLVVSAFAVMLMGGIVAVTPANATSATSPAAARAAASGQR